MSADPNVICNKCLCNIGPMQLGDAKDADTATTLIQCSMCGAHLICFPFFQIMPTLKHFVFSLPVQPETAKKLKEKYDLNTPLSQSDALLAVVR